MARLDECPVCAGHVGRGRRCNNCGIGLPVDAAEAMMLCRQMAIAKRLLSRVARNRDFLVVERWSHFMR